VKVRFLDKNARNFINFSLLLIILLIIATVFFIFLYRYSTIILYNYILLIAAGVIIIMVLAAAGTAFSVIHVYKAGYAAPLFIVPVKIALKFLFPLVLLITGIFKGDKDEIRKVFVKTNNLSVESNGCKYRPEDILVLLPHCIQYSGCKHRIIHDMNNCKQCGKCPIGEILKIVKEKNVKARVVTGGTAARSAVKHLSPKIIVSVACERDMASGITDVRGIPVLGIINTRPKGPCLDTMVDLDLFKKKLELVIEKC
jgi:hypothetical protein